MFDFKNSLFNVIANVMYYSGVVIIGIIVIPIIIFDEVTSQNLVD